MATGRYAVFGAPIEQLTRALEHRPTPLSIRHLLQHGGRPGKPVGREDLLRSADFTRRELPIRLARRVRQFYSLPFLVATNPHIQAIARLYAHSFVVLSKVPHITSEEANDEYTEQLQSLVLQHAANAEMLSRGLYQCRSYMDEEKASRFLNAVLHSRIGIRLIAEQHLALTEAAAHARGRETAGRYARGDMSVGVIELRMRPADSIRASADYVRHLCEATYEVAPPLQLDGDTDVACVGVPIHLEYVMTELLKNSFRATTERYLERKQERQETEARRQHRMRRVLAAPSPPSQETDSEVLPPVRITVTATPSHVIVRIRDRGGGIAPENMGKVYNHAFSTVPGTSGEDSGGDGGLQSSMGTLAGLGYGLPMARLYTEYFGNSSVDLVSLWGYGCDTYLRLSRHIDTSDVRI